MHYSDFFENCGWRLFWAHPLGRGPLLWEEEVLTQDSVPFLVTGCHLPPDSCRGQEANRHPLGRSEGATTLLTPYFGVTLQGSLATASAHVSAVGEFGLTQNHCSFLLVQLVSVEWS